MILFEEFTDEQKQIVKQICFTQLNSLRRIYNDKHHSSLEVIQILQENEIELEDFENQLEIKLEKFKDLHKKPENLGSLSDSDLSVFRHILSQIEDKYNEQYPLAVSNLWQKLFWIENMRNTGNLN